MTCFAFGFYVTFWRKQTTSAGSLKSKVSYLTQNIQLHSAWIVSTQMKKLQCLLKKSSQICKHARKGVLMVASNSFSIYFWYIKNKYCNSHPKFLSLLQFLSVVPRSAKLLRGRKCIISLPLLPVFCINPAVAKFEWKIIPLPFGNVHDSWPKRII